MDRDDNSDRRWADSTETHEIHDEKSSRQGSDLVSSHGEVNGTSMFIIAAAEIDHAWIAISPDAAIDPMDHY
jgi:hypothetical protein